MNLKNIMPSEETKINQTTSMWNYPKKQFIETKKQDHRQFKVTFSNIPSYDYFFNFHTINYKYSMYSNFLNNTNAYPFVERNHDYPSNMYISKCKHRYTST